MAKAKYNIINEIKKEVTKPEPQGQTTKPLPDQQTTKPLPDQRKEPITNPEQSVEGLKGQPKVVSQAEMKELVKNAVSKLEGKPEAQQAPRPEQKTEPKPELKIEPKPKLESQAQQAPRPEGKTEPKFEQKTEPKPEQKPQQPAQQKQKQKPYYRPQPQDTISGFVGKDVSLNLRTGSKLKGRLESVTQYDVVITASYKPIIVLKHAIDYVELV